MAGYFTNPQTQLRRLFVLGKHIGKVRSAHLSTCSPNVEVSTPRALLDDKVKITVHGLEKGQQVTLQTYLKEAGKTYGACGQYVASDKGIVDTWTDVSHGGTFEGVEPMGLFWSMKTVPGVKPGRLIKADVMVPYEVTVAVQNGFRKFEDLQWSNNISSLASCCLERTYSGPGVKRVPVKENGLYGTLFLPPGEGPFPAVIDLFGLTGGIIETRSALLASRGVASFSVAYVDHEDLPKIDTSLDFHYFLKAFDWLASQPQVDPNSLGGIATCVGGGYLQLIGFMRPAMKCLVIINGTGCPFGLDQVVEGEHISPLQFRYDRISFVDGMASFRTLFEPEDRKKLCQSWRHGAKHLWIHGLDDQCVHPIAMEGFKASVPEDFKKNFTFVTFPGAGHLIEPPYAPLCRFNYNAIFKKNMLWGGEPILHAKAQEGSWSLIQAFLEENLRRS